MGKVDPSFVPQMGKRCTNSLFPKNPALRPLVDIPLPNRGVFLSCTEVDVDGSDGIMLECYYRTSYASNTISKVNLDGNLHIASDVELNIAKGQDPRVFHWNRKVHTTDNKAFDNKIKEMNDKGHHENATWKIPNFIAPLKNVVAIPENKQDIMFADFEAEKLFKCSGPKIDSLACHDSPLPNIKWHYEEIGGAKTTGWKYRGGSSGRKIDNHTFIGFGHLTDMDSAHHDIFTWKLSRKPDGTGTDVIMSYVNQLGGEKYDHHITDPTSVFCMNNTWHVITAESDDYWSHDQGYYQRVYRVVDHVTDNSNYSHYNDVPL